MRGQVCVGDVNRDGIGELIGTSFRADADPLPELNASMTVRLSESEQTVVRNELD